jgi:predicted  nucleic acid-binding Zn-ribbon protein
LGANASDATKKLQEQLDAMKKIHAQDVYDQIPDLVEGIREENKDVDKEISKLQDNKDAIENFFSDYDNSMFRESERNEAVEKALDVALKGTGAKW